MNKKLLELFEEHINFPEDNTKACWYDDGNQVMYNTDNNVEALMDENGETYSGEIRGTPIKIDGYVLYTLDSQQGWDYQAIFSLALKVEENEP